MQAEKEDEAQLERQRKAVNEQNKMFQQKIAEKRRMAQAKSETSKKRKASNADKDAMALASSFSLEEIDKMVEDESEALGGMVKEGDNTADGSSHSGEADSGEADSVKTKRTQDSDEANSSDEDNRASDASRSPRTYPSHPKSRDP